MKLTEKASQSGISLGSILIYQNWFDKKEYVLMSCPDLVLYNWILNLHVLHITVTKEGTSM